MSEEQNKNEDNDLNIFKELSWELDFWKVEEEEKVQKKDKLYYMSLWAKISNYIMIFSVFIAITVYWYVYIQKNENMLNSPFLDTIKILIQQDLESDLDSRSSVFALHKYYSQKNEELEKEIISSISKNFMWIYEINSFKDSKEAVFLQTTYPSSKTKTLEIISDFLSMKNKFSPEDKQIVCSNFKLDNQNILETTCDFYTTDFSIIKSSDLKSFIKWSRWVLSASFINYIQKTPENNFVLIEKPKEFLVEENEENPPYTKKTTIKLKLKYSNILNNL